MKKNRVKKREYRWERGEKREEGGGKSKERGGKAITLAANLLKHLINKVYFFYISLISIF